MRHVAMSACVVMALLMTAGAGPVLAQVCPPAIPPPCPTPEPATILTEAKDIRQVFVLTSSDDALYTNPTGAFEPLPSTALTVHLKHDSVLVVGFSARATVEPSPFGFTPIVFVRCEIDDTPCKPNFNPVEFLYPQFCCDTRSFTWAGHSVKKGTHTVSILWGMGNPTLAIMTNRTLIVEAAPLHED